MTDVKPDPIPPAEPVDVSGVQELKTQVGKFDWAINERGNVEMTPATFADCLSKADRTDGSPQMDG